MSWLSLPTEHSVPQLFPRMIGIACVALFLLSVFALSTFALGIDDARLAWPRTATTATGDKVTFSQPQVDEWRDDMLYAKVATRVQLANAPSSVEGTVSLRARTTINHADRTVTLRDITVPALRFPADENQIKALRDAATGSLKIAPITVAFDDLVASMQTQAFPTPTSTIISNDPPRIIFQDSLVAKVVAFSDSSLEIIQSDGALKFDPIVANELEGAANTSSLLFRDHEGSCYLLASGRWLTADSIDSAAWTFLEPAQLPPPLHRFQNHLDGRRRLQASPIHQRTKLPFLRHHCQAKGLCHEAPRSAFSGKENHSSSQPIRLISFVQPTQMRWC